MAHIMHHLKSLLKSGNQKELEMKAALENYSVFMVKADIFSLLLFTLYHSSLYATVHYLSLYLNFALAYI